MSSLIIFPFLRIENGEDIFVVVALRHVDITYEVAHQETVFAFVYVVHYFVLVVGMDEIFTESDIFLRVELSLVIGMSDCIRLKLVRMNRNIPILFFRQRVQAVTDRIGNPTAYDIERDVGLLEDVEELAGIGPVHEVAIVKDLLGHLFGYLILLESFCLEFVELADQV